jgi:hypothetical protein
VSRNEPYIDERAMRRKGPNTLKMGCIVCKSFIYKIRPPNIGMCMVVSHPSDLLSRADGSFEGADVRRSVVKTSADVIDYETVPGNLREIHMSNENQISWITGNLTISF